MSKNYISRHVKLGLKVHGMWPGYTSMLGFYIVTTTMILSLVFQILHAVIIFSNLDILMSNLGATMAIASSVLKLIALRIKGRSVNIIMNEIFEDWEIENQKFECKVMKQHMKRANYLTKWFIGAYNMTVMTYLINAIIAYNSRSIGGRLYVLPAKFPECFKKSPIFEIVCFMQFVAAMFSTNSHALIEGLLTILILHAGTKVYLFEEELEKLSNICRFNDDKAFTSRAMKLFIKKHRNFLTYVERIRDIYAYISFIHVFTFTFLHVIVGYMFIDTLERGDRSIKLFLYGLFTIRSLLGTMIHCIAGEYLMNQSKRIFQDLYNCPWYEFDLKDLKAMNFIIMKARKPICLVTAKFNELSLTYLTSVIRTSFSFLSLARAVR